MMECVLCFIENGGFLVLFGSSFDNGWDCNLELEG